MSTNSSESFSFSPLGVLGRIFNVNTKPSRLSGTLNSIHYSICQELEAKAEKQEKSNADDEVGQSSSPTSTSSSAPRTTVITAGPISPSSRIQRSDSAASGLSSMSTASSSSSPSPSPSLATYRWVFPSTGHSVDDLHALPVSVPLQPEDKS